MHPTKVAAVRDWKTPSHVLEVRNVLGLCIFCRTWGGGFVDIAKPLDRLTETEIRLMWSRDHQQSFETLKNLLTSAPIFGYPVSHTLDADANGVRIGAVLSQVQDVVERVISY